MTPDRVDWSGPARRALQRLPEKVATAAVELIYGSVAANPSRAGKPLTLGMRCLHSASRGDYRVVYAIDADEHAVVIVAIDHRADIYRRGRT